MKLKKRIIRDKEFREDRLTALIGLAIDELAAKPDEVSGQSIETESCPSAEELAAFLDGLLGNEARAKIVVHLDRCRKCYREVLDMSTSVPAAFLWGGPDY